VKNTVISDLESLNIPLYVRQFRVQSKNSFIANHRGIQFFIENEPVLGANIVELKCEEVIKLVILVL
jgi:hypothetical protein